MFPETVAWYKVWYSEDLYVFTHLWVFSKMKKRFFRCRNAALFMFPGSPQAESSSLRGARDGRMEIVGRWRWRLGYGCLKIMNPQDDWVVVSNIFYVHPYLGKWSKLTNIFQRGWNHQPDEIFFCSSIFVSPNLYQFFVKRVWPNDHFGIINFIADIF